MVRKGEMMDVDDIVDLLSIDLIGVVPDDEYIITQTNKGEPVIQNKKAGAVSLTMRQPLCILLCGAS